jgi:cytoskeleton protein RodZ
MTENTSEDNTTDQSNSDHQAAMASAYARIGEQLAMERQRQGLDLSEMSTRLNLPGATITDLEQGRVDRLAGIYRRGYITNYARALGLEPAELLAELEPDHLPELRDVLPAGRHAGRMDRFLKIATYALVTTVIVPPLVIMYIQSGSRMVDREPASTETVMEQTETGSERARSSRISRALGTDDEQESSDQGPRHITAAVLPSGAVRTLMEPSVADQAAVMGPPEPDYSDAVESELMELSIRLRDDSWVEISSADGQRLEYDLLRSGQERRYEGKPPFRILLGRANSVELRSGGELIEYEGHDRGDVIQLELLADGRVVR